MPATPASLVSIRVASPNDVSAMVPVINAAFAVETFIEGVRTSEEKLRKMMAQGEFLVAAEPAGQVVACVYTETSGARGYFGMLAVNPSRQGTGLGRIMLQAAEDHCRRRGCTFMEISVLSPRTELWPFYRKFGYVESRTEVFHPSRPLKPGVECHSVIMAKTL